MGWVQLLCDQKSWQFCFDLIDPLNFSASGKTFVSVWSVRSTFCRKSCKHSAWLSKKSRLYFDIIASVGAPPKQFVRNSTSGRSSGAPGWYWLQNAYLANVSIPATSSASMSAVGMSTWAALCWKATLLSSAIRIGLLSIGYCCEIFPKLRWSWSGKDFTLIDTLTNSICIKCWDV